MMNKMIVANLVHRPIRSLISIVAIALEVTLILLIVMRRRGCDLRSSRGMRHGVFEIEQQRDGCSGNKSHES